MSAANPDLRAPEWEKDGVAMNSEGYLMIRDGTVDAGISRLMTPMQWIAESGKAWALEREVNDLRCKIRNMTPSLLVPELIRQLDEKRELCERSQSELSTGSAMAYAHAAAMLREAMK